MEGMELLRTLVEATGLPPAAVEPELLKLLSQRGLTPESVRLEDVREILAVYLQDVLLEAKAAY